MTQTSQTKHNLRLQLLSFLLAAAAYQSQVSAFVTSPSAHHTAFTQGTRTRPLFVVADPPGREEEKEKLNNQGDDDGDDSWVATSNGGFLPKIPRVFKEKLAPRKTDRPTEVVTLQEYKAVVADEKEQMVCVRFYAPWCKACKAVQQPFRKLCRDNPSVKFVEVPLTKENAFLHEGLGIPSLPYGHIYHPEAGLVEERKIKKKEFNEFAQVLSTYVQGGCSVEYPEEDVCRQASN